MSAPTRTQPMREAILLALAHPHLREEGPIASADIAVQVVCRFEDTGRCDFLNEASNRAFERALDGLVADGLVARDPDGFGYSLRHDAAGTS